MHAHALPPAPTPIPCPYFSPSVCGCRLQITPSTAAAACGVGVADLKRWLVGACDPCDPSVLDVRRKVAQWYVNQIAQLGQWAGGGLPNNDPSGRFDSAAKGSSKQETQGCAISTITPTMQHMDATFTSDQASASSQVKSEQAQAAGMPRSTAPQNTAVRFSPQAAGASE